MSKMKLSIKQFKQLKQLINESNSATLEDSIEAVQILKSGIQNYLSHAKDFDSYDHQFSEHFVEIERAVSNLQSKIRIFEHAIKRRGH